MLIHPLHSPQAGLSRLSCVWHTRVNGGDSMDWVTLVTQTFIGYLEMGSAFLQWQTTLECLPSSVCLMNKMSSM